MVDEPYGPLGGGKGTRLTKVEKLREICGKRNSSADFAENVKLMAKRELMPRPHKRQLEDGLATFDLEKRRKTHDKLQAHSPSPAKSLDEDPDSEYIKVPCKFNGW